MHRAVKVSLHGDGPDGHGDDWSGASAPDHKHPRSRCQPCSRLVELTDIGCQDDRSGAVRGLRPGGRASALRAAAAAPRRLDPAVTHQRHNNFRQEISAMFSPNLNTVLDRLITAIWSRS